MLPKDDSSLLAETVFVHHLKRFFRFIGGNVATRPYIFILVSLLATLFCSVSLLTTKMTNDVTDFTPKGARARKELAIYNTFFGYKGEPIIIYVFITAKDGGSILGVQHLSETVRLLDSISNDVQIKSDQTNETLIFSQFCTSFCELNEPVRSIYNGLMVNEKYNETSALIDLAYPVTTILGQKFRIDINFYGVQVGEENGLVDARLVVLQFRAVLPAGTGSHDAERYEMEVVNYLQRNFTSDVVNAVAMTPAFITSEIVRAGLTLLPFTIVGFIIMCIFSTATVLISSMLASQFDFCKVIVAVAACVSPLLACSTALGLLLWCGMRFGSILCVTPFLVLAIGVDDAFLMMNSWQRICLRAHKQIKPKYYKEEKMEVIRNRMCSMLQEVGPSITITTLTNVLAFGIGALSPTPEIQIFCISNAVAMIFDFIYQITLFAAIMVVVGRRELHFEEFETTIELNKWFIKQQNNINSVLEWLLNSYCATLSSRAFSVLTAAGLLLYWSFSIYGAFTVNVELKPEKLLSQDSDLIKVLRLRDIYIMPYYAPTLVFVGSPGNLNNPNNIRMLHKIVEDFETLPSSVGPSATKFWLRDYEDFVEVAERAGFDGAEENRNSTAIGIKPHDLQNFLDWPEFRYWNGFLQFEINNRGSEYLKSYFFMISSFGDLKKWSNRAKLLDQLRNVADRYPLYNVSVYDDDAKFLDLIGTLLNQTIQSSACTLICMMLVCFIFIPQFNAVLIATFSIFSIFLGVFGILSLWGVDLDPIVMSAMIMSIGFSVDIPAHVTYHFFRADGYTTEARLRQCFAAIAFPVLQAAASTLLCVLSLLFVDLHMAHVFMKTMTLVVMIGLVHGLLVIPVFFNILSGCQMLGRRKVFEITGTKTPKVVAIPEDVIVSVGADTKLKISIY